MNEQLLKAAFTLVAGQVKKRFRQGKIQTWQSTDGYLALMVDKIQRYFDKPGYDELLSLCVDSLCALGTALDVVASGKVRSTGLDDNDEKEVAAELEQEIEMEKPPEERKINPNALEEGEELDPRWTTEKERSL